MRTSLAVKYRPKTFEEVCDQKITVQILKKLVENRAFKNAYLFAGDSGCGKTTLARIFANAINRGEGSPIEIDGAAIAGEGSDAIRAVIEDANKRSLDSEYKIYIIDECHIFHKNAWASFLKSLEEPAPYTIYMLCTTEPNKVPEAILNRVQRYNITKVNAETIKNRLVYICQNEGFTNYEKACDLISKTCAGSVRDAITSLEKCADYSKDLSLDNVKLILQNLSYEALFALTWALQDKDEGKVLQVIENLYMSGTDLKSFVEDYLDLSLNLTKFALFKNIKATSIPGYLATDENPVVQETVKISSIAWFNNLTNTLLELKAVSRYDNSFKSTLEATLLKFCRG